MKQNNLPFKLGEHYERWEFELEILDFDKIKGHESYIYLKNVFFLNLIPLKVELIFSFDILELIIMEINPTNHKEIEDLLNLLSVNFGNYVEQEQEYLSACIYKLEDSNELWLIYKPLEDETYIAYGNSKLIIQLFCI